MSLELPQGAITSISVWPVSKISSAEAHPGPAMSNIMSALTISVRGRSLAITARLQHADPQGHGQQPHQIGQQHNTPVNTAMIVSGRSRKRPQYRPPSGTHRLEVGLGSAVFAPEFLPTG